MRGKLKRFREIVQAVIDRKKGRAYLLAEATFEQYVALEHAVEEAGGAIKMFHPRYLVPQANYASLGAAGGRDPDRLETLRKNLQAVRGVRTAIIDADRWFTNEKGVDIGGAVVFADRNPTLELNLIQAAKSAGFVYEPKEHGHEADDSDEWSEMNHAFAGLCLITLSLLGMLHLGLPRPPAVVKYGTVLVWLAMLGFLFIRADRTSWPLGPMSWWESFREPDTAQHRLGLGVLLLVAVGDYVRLRKGWKVDPALGRWGMLGLGLVGAGMLFTHLHTTLDPSHYAMVRRMNGQHMAMAGSVLLFAVSKFTWDTWQVPRRWGQYLWLVFLLILGVLLTVYVE